LGTAVISSICAADTAVIPIGSDPFSFKGLELTLSEIEAICDTYQLPLPKRHILFSRYDRREKMAEQAIATLAETYRDQTLPVHIRVSTEYAKALARHETVFAYTRKSNARTDYDLYVRHLLNLPKPKQPKRKKS
jgi:cellulose biosynthesis protein BcsQ